MNRARIIPSVLASLFVSASLFLGVSATHASTMAEAGIGAGSTNDALFAIENNRLSIVERILANFDSQIKVKATDSAGVRAGLLSLRADQLLSASLSNSLQDVMVILAEPVATGPATHRYVAITPTAANGFVAPDHTISMVLRNSDDLSLARTGDLSGAAFGTTVVGYFVPNINATAGSVGNTVSATSASGLAKDGVGTGTASWIGFTAGGNLASGPNSGVAAGTNNQASGNFAFVGAGVSNKAIGTSALVIGGFDNQAVAIDSLVGAGAGNRAVGARSVVVGGGYNLASGNFSFIGGGGRDGTGGTAAGTDPNLDNRAFGRHSFVGAGKGNVAGVSGSGDTIRSNAVVGGARNTASGYQAFVGAGGCNVASGTSAVVAGGGQTSDTGTCSFGNTASGDYSFIGGGFSNVAAGLSSVAMGQGATVNDSNSFVFSGNGAYTPANGSGTFNIAAPGGVHINTDTRLNFGSQTRQMLNLWGPTNYGIGVQGGTLYGRADNSFAWFTGGVHSDATFDAGAGGTTRMTLNAGTLSMPSVDSQLSFPQANNNLQQIEFRGTGQGVGGQAFTAYMRTNSSIGFYVGGAHVGANQLDPGAGGSVLATIQNGVGSATVTGNVRALGFTATSDRAAKTEFAAVNAKGVLAKVAALPVSTWTYIAEKTSGVRHIGPMAQDFMKAFNVGYDDKSISTIDASGVALTAIKGLSEIVQEKDAQIKRLERELNAIKKKLGM